MTYALKYSRSTRNLTNIIKATLLCYVHYPQISPIHLHASLYASTLILIAEFVVVKIVEYQQHSICFDSIPF